MSAYKITYSPTHNININQSDRLRVNISTFSSNEDLSYYVKKYGEVTIEILNVRKKTNIVLTYCLFSIQTAFFHRLCRQKFHLLRPFLSDDRKATAIYIPQQ